jgi:hypothetical protein
VFFPAMSLGALLYIMVYTLLGYFLGPPVLRLLEAVHIPFGLLGSLLPLTLLLLWTLRARQALGRRVAASPSVEREVRLRAGALAGLLATITSTLLLNVSINLVGGIAFNAPGTLVEQTAARLAFALAREVQPILLFVAVPGYLGVGTLWGAVYGYWVEARLPADWPDWQKGLAFAGAPLLVSLVIVMPLLGLGFLGITAAGPLIFTGELLRHAVYGVMLGLVYPVLRTRRPVKVRAHTPTELPAEQPLSAEI